MSDNGHRTNIKLTDFDFDTETETPRRNDILETEIQQDIHEQDVRTFALPGIIPGPKSSEIHNDPDGTWMDIDSYDLPGGVIPSQRNLKEWKNSSYQRYEIDSNYRGVIDGFLFFIIGEGMKISPLDESEQVHEYVKKWIEVNEFDGRDRDMVEKFLKAGECYVRFFTKTSDGRIAKFPLIRLYNYWEISKCDFDPNDREKIIKAYRPYKKSETETEIEEIPGDEIIHVKFGCKDDQYGKPPFAAIMKFCEYYSDWLFNRVVLNRTKTAYYLEMEVDGSPSDVTTADNTIPDGTKAGRGGKLIKRMPKPGSVLIHNKSVSYKWLSPEVKADDAKEDGRAIRMSICAGAQCPEFMLGDSSNTNFASALIAQNPFVRKIQYLQDYIEFYVRQIFKWVLTYAIQNKILPSTSQETIMREKSTNVTFIRRMKKIFDFKEQYDSNGNIVVKETVPTKVEIDVNWPPLIAQNMLQESQAYQIHQAMGVVSNETLSQKLGYDWEEEMRKMERSENQDKADDENLDDETKKRDDEINNPFLKKDGDPSK